MDRKSSIAFKKFWGYVLVGLGVAQFFSFCSFNSMDPNLSQTDKIHPIGLFVVSIGLFVLPGIYFIRKAKKLEETAKSEDHKQIE